jgi:hypothetical protein
MFGIESLYIAHCAGLARIRSYDCYALLLVSLLLKNVETPETGAPPLYPLLRKKGKSIKGTLPGRNETR